MRVLIIEDQEKLAQLVKKGLEKEGFAVDYLTDGEAGQKRVELNHRDYDLVILDLMLPGVSGYEICRGVREQKISTPILILTAKDSTEDKVSLLDAGADDYLVKPFSFEELLARVRALLRRPEASLPVELEVGNIVLSPSTRKVTQAGKEIRLTLKEFGLLEFLMRNAGQIMEREKIITSVWDFDVDVFNNVVDVYINKLRVKLGDNQNQNIIETIRGIGYRLKK